MSQGHRASPNGRGRATQRTYQVRRIVVGAGLLALGWGAFSVLTSVFGGDDTQEVAAVEPTINTVISDGNPTTVPETTTTTTTEPSVKEIVAPSAADPAEVLILGDSDAGTFGPYLKTLLDDTL